MSEFEKYKNPVCVIKDEPVNVFGGQVDVIAAHGEHVECPKCGSRNLKVIRNISVHPMGFRIACDNKNCRFSVPEFLEERAYTTEEGVELAVETWDRYAVAIAGLDTDGAVEAAPLTLSDGSVLAKEGDKRYLYADGAKIDLDAMEINLDEGLGKPPFPGTFDASVD